MTEIPSAPAPDTAKAQCIENVVSPVTVEHDAKRTVRSATENSMDQVDVSPSSPSPSLERWNESRTNMYRYFAALYSFIVMGMNDAASGVSIP
jgi:hypothetical protein